MCVGVDLVCFSGQTQDVSGHKWLREVGGDGGLGQDEKCCGWAEGPMLGRLVRERKWDLGMKKWGKKSGRGGEMGKPDWDKRPWGVKKEGI